MAKRFTSEQERILNEWARTASELRRAFPYTIASNTQTQGLGFHLNKDVDTGQRFYITARQSDGLQSLDTTSILTFNRDSFYLSRTSNPGEMMVNFSGSAGSGSSGVTDHGLLEASSLLDDDHPQYVLVTGTRAFTGDQSMGGNQLTNVGAPIAGTDAARLQDISPGFYGISIKQQNELESFKGINTITFSNLFYITQNSPNTDEVFVDLREQPSFRKVTFSFPESLEWTADHNLSSTDLVVSIYDNRQRIIIPEQGDISNPNVAYFYFIEAQAGKVVMVG